MKAPTPYPSSTDVDGSAPAESSAEVRALASRYLLLRILAKGGTGEVWEARDAVLDRLVAAKVLHQHLATQAEVMERFRREAVAAARLAHPAIVATFDAGMVTKPAVGGASHLDPNRDDVAFIVMELVRGPSLAQALAADGRFAPERALPIAITVADALAHAHAHGIIHRDVKPANILLAADGSEERAKVADFGIARALSRGSDLTRTGTLIGSARYLAPEQVSGGGVDLRCDLYALGVVLYEMLCGRVPFEGETEMAIAIQHVQAEVLPPRELQPAISPDLEAVVLKALAKNPDDRWRTAGEMGEALRRALDGVAAQVPAPGQPVPSNPMPRTDAPQPGTPRRPGARAARRSERTGGRCRRRRAEVEERRQERRAGALLRIRRSWTKVAAGVVAAVLLVAGTLLLTAGRRTADTAPQVVAATDARPPGSSVPGPPSLVRVSSFDPEGSDGRENEELATMATDGDPATKWRTETYHGPAFAGLKNGVGLVFELEQPVALQQLRVDTSTRHWSAEIYVAEAPEATREAWGPAVTRLADLDGGATFDLGGRRGGAVLLWITNPGNDRQADVAEVVLRSAATEPALARTELESGQLAG